MALRTAQYILDVNNSNDDSDSSGYRGIEPVVHYSAHPYDNNIGLHLSILPQSTHEEAQSEISTHIYNHPEESNVNPNNCRFDTKCRLLITIGCLILIVSTISVTTVMLNSSKSDGREVDLGRLTTRLTSCSNFLELGLGETKTVICSLPNVSANANSGLSIERVDMNGSDSGFMMADLLFVKDRTDLIINFTFVNFECTDEGNYSVFILKNGTLTSIHNISVALRGKLDPFSLCQSSYNLDIRGSKEIKCSLQKETNENYSVCIEKVDGNRSGCMNAELQLEYSSDCLWYNIIFVFYAVTCNDSGNYSIGLMENGTMMRSSHNFSVLVQDTPDTIQPCNRTFELGLGETRNFTCFLKTGLDHDNGNVFVAKLDVDISNSSSGSLNDYLGFTASSNHDNMIINFTFSNVKCDDEGNYSIEFSENGTLHRIHTFFVEVIGHSTPLERCQKSYNVYFGRSKTFECALERTIEEFTDISIEKDNNQSSGSAIHNLFYKTSSDCGTHNIDFTFVDARCKDEGTYLIKILQNFTVHRLHNFYMSVPVNLQKPQIEKVNVSRGYISGEMMQLKCEATTGCSFKNLEWIRRPEGTDIDIVLPQTITNYTIDDITSTYEVITLFLSELTDQSNGDEYRCRIQGTDVVSDPYVVSIVTGEFCKTREIKCDYRHPSECDVWVVCESNDHPLIYRCSHGLFYKPATNCTCCNGHACEHPDKANCPYG